VRIRILQVANMQSPGRALTPDMMLLRHLRVQIIQEC
jgi:hypothetical protein